MYSGITPKNKVTKNNGDLIYQFFKLSKIKQRHFNVF